MMRDVIRLIRVKQWVKNIFVFLPIVFGGQLFNVACWREGIPAFIAFCLIASSIYCINDIRDAESDRRHPRKCKRPIASGEISVPAAIAITMAFAAASLSISAFLTNNAPEVTAIILFYFILNILYCFKLKQITIVDVIVISIGFVLRLFAGGIACGIELSPWIVLMTFLISLFLAFAKRRDDLVMYEEDGIDTRKNVKSYNMEYLNLVLGLLVGITVICYIMYTLSDDVITRIGSKYVYVTSIFVIAGMFRYLQIALVHNNSGSPTEILLHDHFIHGCIICWLFTFGILLYR
ncbi:MAG: decaprenyl-phosphate phosphoribosyltransferase [Candidatus Amulumruptor caecigallinarius]|nr:decaprenyl-phosphate phosphoribosyltransferase [Candidatus Amulumruptor caecigallinarius]